jgi:hypothetical protein
MRPNDATAIFSDKVAEMFDYQKAKDETRATDVAGGSVLGAAKTRPG